MKNFFISLLFITANLNAFAVEPLCSEDLSVGQVIVDQSIQNFCIDARKDKVASLFTYDDPASIHGKNFKTDAEFLNFLKNTPDEINSSAWNFSLYPDSKVNKVGYARKLTKRHGIYGFESENEVRDFLGDVKNGVTRYQSKFVSDRQENIKDLLKYPSDQASDFKQSSATTLALCATYTQLHAIKCAEALDKIITLMAPRSNITIIPIMAKVLDDPSYQAGSAKAAIKIMARVKNGNINGNLFNDIKSSFKEVGMNDQNAEDHTWNLIAVWAARGPNTDFLMPYSNNKNYHTILSLDVISSAIPYLDSLASEKGLPGYSYPPTVKTKCSYGKSYHFWMSAFLTREISKQTGDPVGAMYAAYLAEIGYQMKSKTNGRDPARVFMVDTHDVANNKLRIDVAFGSAGAVYGMQVASKQSLETLQIDNAINEMIKKSTEKPKLTRIQADKLWTGTGMEGYLRWKSVMAPDSGLDVLLKD